MFLGLAVIVAAVFAALAGWALKQRSEAITASTTAQQRLEAIQISLQAMLSHYINYLDHIGFPAAAVSMQIAEGKEMNAWYDGKDMFVDARLAGDVDAPRREYTHHVLYSKNRLGVIDQNQPMQQIESALADYFPCSFADRPSFGEIVAAVMNLGPYLRNLNNSRKFDETQELGGEVHERGEIWGGAFWELRSLLGRDLADRLLARAWQSMAWPIAERDTARKFIDALLSNARESASDQQVTEISTTFRKRGFPTPG
jgi:hypothetical protein